MTSQTTAAELPRAKAAARYLTKTRGTTSLTSRHRLPFSGTVRTWQPSSSSRMDPDDALDPSDLVLWRP